MRTPTGVFALKVDRSFLAAAGLTMLLAGCGGGSGALPPSSGTMPFGTANRATQSGTSATGASVLQTASAGSAGGSATSVSAKLATAPQSGDYLVAFVGVGDTSAVTTAPSGWSAAKDAAGHACQQVSGPHGSQGERVFVHRVAAGESGPYAFAFSKASSYAVAIVDVANVSTTTPIDACAGTQPAKSTSTGPVTAATVTATAAGDLPLAGYAPSTSGLTVTPQTGWSSTLYANTQTPYMTLDVESGAAVGSGVATTPSTTFGNLGGAAIVYAPSVSLLLESAPVPLPTPAPIASTTTGAAVVQNAVAGTVGGSATTLAANLTRAPQSGNYVVAFVGEGDTTSAVTPPNGWSAANDVAGHACAQLSGPSGSQGEQVFIHRAASGEAGSYSFAFTKASSYAIGLVELSNLNANAPIDACAGAEPAKGTSTGVVSAATITAVTAGDLPVVAYAPSTSGLTVSPASGWNASLYANVQTPYMTLDLESGAALNGSSSLTPSTTFGSLGGSAIVYAPSVTVLFAPAQLSAPTVAATSTPVSVSTPVPTPVPTTVPTAAPTASSSVPAFQNGVEYPTSWRPYGANSVWNQTVPASPALWSGSSATIAQQFNSAGLNNIFVRSDEAGPYDYSHPIYFASSSDPVVTISCRTYCDQSDNGGLPTTIHIPAQARPAGGADSHMAVIQPDQTEIDFFGTTKPSGNWGTSGNTAVTAGSVMNCGSFVTGSGIDPNGAVTVGGACLGAGIVRANELSAGRINHALFLVVNCAAPASQNQYPVQNGAGTDVCTNYSAGHAAPPLGARLWLDYSDAQIAAMGVAPWEKALLYALHDYGAYIEDDVAGGSDISGMNFKYEGGDMFYSMGTTDPYSQIAGWNNIGIPSGSLTPRYVGGDPWQPAGVDFAGHLHYVAPCVTQKTC